MTMQTFTGTQYLQIDIANNFGLDKEDWSDRLIWFTQNEHQLHKLIKQADEPALYFAGLQAWQKAKQGKPCGYPISLDATSSGIQILACLTGDRKAARHTNVVDTGHRRDFYVNAYHIMVDKAGDKAKIERKETKRAIMTSFYASKAVPKQVFGEGDLLNIFFETMKEEAPGAWELNEALLALWQPDAYSHDWVLPDNFHVRVKVMSTVREDVHFLNKPYVVSYSVNAPMPEGRSLGANLTHSIDGMVVRELGRRCMYDIARIGDVHRILKVGTLRRHKNEDQDDRLVKTLWKHFEDSGFLSARILDHINDYNVQFVDPTPILELIDSLPQKPFEILSIHDCFRCLPNYGNDLRRQYNQLLSEIARSELLSYLVSQILGRKVQVGKLDRNLHLDILEANYALS